MLLESNGVVEPRTHDVVWEIAPNRRRCEGFVKLRLGTGVAVIAILSAVGSSLAVDRPRERGTQSRLPKASTASDWHGDVLSSRAKVRDDHVFEFLRWKDRLRAKATRVRSGD